MPSKRQLRKARETISRRFNTPDRPGITDVYVGFKERGGEETDQPAVVVRVTRKKPLSELPERDRIPQEVEGVQTDVQEGPMLKALSTLPLASVSVLTKRLRPCPGGISIGHENVTAGTLGTWVRHLQGGQYILSNNHVLADSNAAHYGDAILQPGPYDKGKAADKIAELRYYAHINFEGEPIPEPPPVDPPRPPNDPVPGFDQTQVLFWTGIRAFIEAVRGAPIPSKSRVRSLPVGAVRQPYPNLVDAALAYPIDLAVVDDSIINLGSTQGVRDLNLGDSVSKSGRTTETTHGRVVGIDGDFQVEYDGKVARFVNQIVIRASKGNFSDGGDSGSVILTTDGYFGGLLFAGGGRDTIANRAQDVISILGIAID